MASLAARFPVPVHVPTPRVRRASRFSRNPRVVRATATGEGEETKNGETAASHAQGWIGGGSGNDNAGVDDSTSPASDAPDVAHDFTAAVQAATEDAATQGTVDSFPSSSPSSFPTITIDRDAEERSTLTRKLLSLAAVTSRGQQTGRTQASEIEDVLIELEFLNPTDEPAKFVDGEWTLAYTNVELFRSSPFFWALQKLAPGGEEGANAVFKFTAGLPVAGTAGPFGQISQTFSLETQELVSEVEMKLFDPFFAVANGMHGCVVSTANVKVCPESDGDVLLVTPRTTRVRNSNLAGSLLDQLVVPTQDLMSASNGGTAVEARATVTYVDAQIRITRVGENADQVFVYTRASN